MSNEQQQHEEIQPDLPQMRSVLIRSAPSSFGEASIPIMPKAAPLRTASSPMAKPAPRMPARVGFSPSTPLWRPKAQSIPDIYPLERSHIKTKGNRYQVAERIAKALKEASIAAEYDDENATATAETQHHVRFAVNMFEADGNVTVEIQRLAGCCINFRESCKKVLNAVKGQSAPSRHLRMRAVPACILTEQQQEVATSDAVANTVDMILSSGRLDMEELGMESLEQLTVDPATRLHAAQFIVRNSSLLGRIAELIQEFSSTNDDEFMKDHAEKMHRYSLGILGNSLEVLVSFNQLSAITAKSIATDDLLVSLVGELAEAQTRPHDACRAAKCLTSLSEVVRDRAVDLELGPALDVAHKEGLCRHALLEEESRQLRAQTIGYR